MFPDRHLGLRELMTLSHLDDRSTDVLAYWNSFLAEWSRSGSWYGLHADTPLGVLAALNLQHFETGLGQGVGGRVARRARADDDGIKLGCFFHHVLL